MNPYDQIIYWQYLMRRGSGSSTLGDQGLRGLRAVVGPEQQIEAYLFLDFSERHLLRGPVPVWLVMHNLETSHQGPIKLLPTVQRNRIMQKGRVV